MQVKAGVAYVDVRLGSVEKFAQDLASKVEAAIKDTTNKTRKASEDAQKQATRVTSGFGQRLANSLKGIPKTISTVRTHLDGISRSVGLASFQMQNFGMISTVAFTAPLGAIATLGTVVGVSTAAKIEQATAALRAMLGPGYDVEALIVRLQKQAIASPIFNTTDLVVFTQKMTASGLAIKDTERFIASFGRIALRSGADLQKIPFALEALVQMVGKGKVSMEELRLQLGDALPGAMKIVSDALGITTEKLYELVSNGELTGTKLVAALTKLGETKPYMEGAAQGADTMASKFQALKESLQTQLGNIFLKNADKIKQAIEKLGPVMTELINNSEGLFDGIVDGFSKLVQKLSDLVKWYSNLSPGQQDMINKLILLAAVLGPAVLAFGAFLGSVAGIAAGLSLLLNPVGAVIIGIIALAAGFVYLWKTSDTFRENVKKVWDSLNKYIVQPFSGVIKQTIEEVKATWKDLTETFSFGSKDGEGSLKALGVAFGVFAAAIAAPIALAVGLIKGIISAIGPLFKGLVHMTLGTIKFLSGVVDLIVGIFTLDFEKMKQGVIKIWDGMWEAVISAGSQFLVAIWRLVKGIVTGIVDFFKWLWDVLVGHSIIPDTVNAIIDWMKKLVNGVKGFFTTLGGWFSSFYDKYIKGFIDAVKSGIKTAIDTVLSIPSKIKSAFSNASSWLYDAGKAIVNGLVNGVKAMGGMLKNAIMALIPGPVKGIVEKALDIHSPSGVFMDYGKNVVLGFVIGLQKYSDQIPKNMNAFNSFVPQTPSVPYAGDEDRMNNSARPGSPLVIENYYANQNSDPRREAENWWFLTTARGGVV